jgi:hypothetical protein
MLDHTDFLEAEGGHWVFDLFLAFFAFVSVFFCIISTVCVLFFACAVIEGGVKREDEQGSTNHKVWYLIFI